MSSFLSVLFVFIITNVHAVNLTVHTSSDFGRVKCSARDCSNTHFKSDNCYCGDKVVCRSFNSRINPGSIHKATCDSSYVGGFLVIDLQQVGDFLRLKEIIDGHEIIKHVDVYNTRVIGYSFTYKLYEISFECLNLMWPCEVSYEIEYYNKDQASGGNRKNSGPTLINIFLWQLVLLCAALIFA